MGESSGLGRGPLSVLSAVGTLTLAMLATLVFVPSAYASVTVPAAPTRIVATPGNTSAVVKWTAPANQGGTAITGYAVVSSPGSKTCRTKGTKTSCIIYRLTNGVRYSVKVRARNRVGLGAVSASVKVTPGVPSAPTSVRAVAQNGQATVTWTAPPNNGSKITKYAVLSPEFKTCTQSITSCTVKGLTNGTHYRFEVTATNARGTGPASAFSNTITPRPLPTLTITASNASQSFGNLVPAISPEYSGFVNGNTAANLTTLPTCVAGTSSSSSVGTYASSCSGAVDPKYSIVYVDGTTTVHPATLTITASNAAQILGDSAPTISPEYSGFVDGNTAADLSTLPKCVSGTSSSSLVGTYASSCSGAADPNYSIVYLDGTVQVDATTIPPTLTITASNANQNLGDSAPTISPDYSGFVDGDNAGDLTTPPTCVSGTSGSSPVGTYSSSCSGAADPNYTIVYVNGTTTVNPATLTITASNATQNFGDPAPTTSPEYSGFVGGDTAADLTTLPTCVSGTTSSSLVGTYSSSCSGAVDPNYTISYVDGTTTVNPATLTITASSGIGTFGGSLPTISPEYSGFVDGNTAADLNSQPVCISGTTSSSVVGTYASACSGAVDPNYSIGYVDGTTTVNPATLLITASNATQTFGGLVPTISPEYSGFVNGNTAANLTTLPTCLSGTSISSLVGTYGSSCSGAVDPNYSISYLPGTTTVNPATLLITASNATQTFGGLVPTISPEYSGFVNGNTAANLTALPSCISGTTSSSLVGSFSSSCSGAVDPNYAISYLDGTTSVNPATLLITASNAAQTYGGLVPTISPEYSGFVNGNTAANLTPHPTCVSGTTTSSPVVGSYTSSCSGAVDPNYTITYAAGTTTVNPATLTITASSATQILDVLVPTISPEYSGFVNNDTASNLTTHPTCVSGTILSSLVGTYPSSCSGAVDPNYTMNYVDGITTVKL